MKNTFLILTLLSLSVAGAAAIGKKLLADHDHPEMHQSAVGPFETAHSGGLDQNGGHYDHKTGLYHYHR